MTYPKWLRFTNKHARFYRKTKEDLEEMAEWRDDYWRRQSKLRGMELSPVCPVAFLKLKKREEWIPFINEVCGRYHLRDETIRKARIFYADEYATNGAA